MVWQRSRNARTVILLTLICVAGVAAFGSWFVVSHTHHNCSGVGCQTCALVHYWADAIQKLSAGLLALLAAGVVMEGLLVRTNGSAKGIYEERSTLIQLKVRLNS